MKICVLKSEFCKVLSSPSIEYSVCTSQESWTQLRGKKKQMGNDQINFFVCVLFPYKPIMLSCSCKGYNEKIKNSVGLLNLRNPGGSVSKTNKPLQVRTPDFETKQKMIAKMLLYQNEYGSNSKCMIFNTK